MKGKYKPNGYNSVSPYIMVDNPGKFIDMLIQIFDAREKRRYTRSNGSIMHAELQIDDSVVMLAEANNKYPVNSGCIFMFLMLTKLSQKLLNMVATW